MSDKNGIFTCFMSCICEFQLTPEVGSLVSWVSLLFVVLYDCLFVLKFESLSRNFGFLGLVCCVIVCMTVVLY